MQEFFYGSYFNRPSLPNNEILYCHFHPDALPVTATHAPNAYRILEYPTTLNYPWQTPQLHHLPWIYGSPDATSLPAQDNANLGYSIADLE